MADAPDLLAALAESLRDQAPMFPRTARLLDALADALADANTPPEATSAPLTALTVAQEGRNRLRSGAGAGIALGGTEGEIGAHRGTQP